MTEESVDKKYAVEIIGKFLPNEWSDVHPKDVTLTPFSGGFMNSLWIVDNNKKNGSKFNRVILRHYGGNLFKIDQNDGENGSTTVKDRTEEILVFQALSGKGWGPKLLGVFPGGRIEEFIPSHTLTPREASHLDIIHDLAVSFARFHSLQLPISKNQMKEIEHNHLNPLAKDLGSNEKILEHLEDPKIKVYDIDWKRYLNMDKKKEIRWIFNRIRQLPTPNVLCNFDTNFQNCLIRNHWRDHDTRTVLIDYEYSMHAPRGIDIGGHFFFRMIDLKADGDKTSGCDFPFENERRLFAKSYLEEKKRLDPLSLNPSQGDTVEHLLEEADIGALFVTLINGIEMIEDELESLLKSQPSFITLIPILLNFYLSYKENCLRKYTHWTE